MNQEDKKPRRSYRNIIVVALAASMFLPAIIIGAVNRPRVNVETISKPFKLIPIVDDGASYPAPKVELGASSLSTPIIQLQEVVIWGDKRKEPKEPATLEEIPSFTQPSLNGGTVRVIGFKPGE